MSFVLLKDVVERISTGLNPRKNFKLNQGGNCNYITIKNIKNGKLINLDSCDKIFEEDLSLINKRSDLRIGDILFASIGANGDCYKITEIPKDWNINESVFSIRPNDKILSDYLMYVLRSEAAINYYKKVQTGSTFKSIKINQLKEMPLSLPSIQEQKELIKQIEKKLQIIDILKQTIYDYDIYLESLFYEMFGSPIKNDKFETKNLGNLLTIERGASPRPIKEYITTEESGVFWIKIGDADSNSMYIESAKEKITEAGSLKSRKVKIGDLILSNSMSFGRPYILKINGCVHDGWLILKKYEESFNKVFLCYMLGLKEIYDTFTHMAVGGVVNNLNSDMVRNLSVIVPPLSLQNDFVDKLIKIEKLKELLSDSLLDYEKITNIEVNNDNY